MKIIGTFILVLILISCGTTKSVQEEDEKSKEQEEPNDLTIARKHMREASLSLNRLIRINGDTDETCGYVNLKGDTVINFGEYQACFTDTITHFGAFLTNDNKFVGVNTKNEVLFEIFTFDNGPDYFSEGTIRIKMGEKIGYVNEKGNIIIQPKYKCAFPFENGRAKVALECTKTKHGEHTHVNSDQWIYIDKKGNKVE